MITINYGEVLSKQITIKGEIWKHLLPAPHKKGNMKKLLFSISALALSVGLFAQAKRSDDVAKFKAETIDLGKIKVGNPSTATFTISNIGQVPLIIEQAKSTCACTISDFTKPPIAAGKTGEITAKFDAATVGTFEKQLIVKFAGVNDAKTITIRGEVLTAEDYDKYAATEVKPTLSTATGTGNNSSTSTEVKSPTSTSTEVRSPTSTSTQAYTAGNVTVTGGAGAGATTSVTINNYGQPDKKEQGALLGEWLNTPGQTVQRKMDSKGNNVEQTLDTTGKVLNDKTVGRMLDLPVINQTKNADGQIVRQLRDTNGAVVECTLDNNGNIINCRVVSKATGVSKPVKSTRKIREKGASNTKNK